MEMDEAEIPPWAICHPGKHQSGQLRTSGWPCRQKPLLLSLQEGRAKGDTGVKVPSVHRASRIPQECPEMGNEEEPVEQQARREPLCLNTHVSKSRWKGVAVVHVPQAGEH